MAYKPTKYKQFRIDGRGGERLLEKYFQSGALKRTVTTIDRGIDRLFETGEHEWDPKNHSLLIAPPDRIIKRKRQWYPKKYEMAVLSNLKKLERTKTGKAVIEEVKAQIIIRPFIRLDSRRNEIEINAYAESIGQYRQRRRNRTLIRYTPGMWFKFDEKHQLGARGKVSNISQEPDRTLLHELVHAVRFTQGISRTTKKVYPNRYDDDDEFFAIVISNIYDSELGRPYVRYGHDDDTLSHQNAFHFVSDETNRKGIKMLKRQMPDLFKKLAAIRCNYNPVNLYGRTKKVEGGVYTLDGHLLAPSFD